ncbi:hypothetical protein TNCV_2181781 [Trichonephila clavipes]|uniref:Uncharacterized protein n=1 Tax=Trichonephila clavipes TaxID=2585209 RepID=A0A8X6VUZ2_TRICX|nr:hypothetical protein TNCV_2181781 [Trichonephila clavipes]
MPVFSTSSDRGPLKSSKASRITVLKPSNTINHNPGMLQFNLYQSPELLELISAFYTRHHNNFSPDNNVLMQFVYERLAEQCPHLNTF